MKHYNELPLYRQSAEVVVMIEKMMAKTSRQYRYTFGERMVSAALHLPMDFYLLYEAKDKELKGSLIEAYIQHLLQLKMLVDVGHQLGLFTYKDFPILIEKLDSLERQINGLKNANAKVSVIKGDR